jgi:hypothetical protein
MTETIDTKVRLLLYREFVKNSRAPSSSRIAELVEMPVEEVRAAMERLAAGRVIALQPESREIMIAAPLSNVPTPYLVRAEHPFFGACIWDALGIMAMLKTNATLDTSCPCCSEAMAIEVLGGALSPTSGIIHFGVPAKKWWENIVFT